MRRVPVSRAVSARYLPSEVERLYYGSLEPYDEPRTDPHATPLDRHNQYMPGQYQGPVHYGPPGPDRTILWIALIVGVIVMAILLLLTFVYITQPPAPIVHHSNPSCLFWCD